MSEHAERKSGFTFNQSISGRLPFAKKPTSTARQTFFCDIAFMLSGRGENSSFYFGAFRRAWTLTVIEINCASKLWV
jgi:hypothetical protein